VEARTPPPASSKHPFDIISKEVSEIRKELLSALKDSQPLIVLATLSLAIAALSKGAVDSAAAPAVAAATSFLAALVIFVLTQIAEDRKRILDFWWSAPGVGAVAIGFVMLALVVREFTITYQIAGNALGAVLASSGLLFLAGGVIGVFGLIDRVRNTDQAVWSRHKVPLAVLAVASVVALAFLVLAWLASYAGVSIDGNYFLVSTGVIMLALFYPILLVERARKK